jgi:hypothetical protein
MVGKKFANNINGCPVMDFGQHKIGFDQIKPDRLEQI